MPLLSIFYLISVLLRVVVQPTDVVSIFVIHGVLAFLSSSVVIFVRISALM